MFSSPPSSYSHIKHEDLNAIPIEPTWVLEGSPVMRVKRIHSSADGLYEVALWECNAGKFRWHFNGDEVVHIVDGEVTVHEDDGTERTLRAGDTALFHVGSTNVWHVKSFVRKVATLRYHRPTPIDLARLVVRKARKELNKVLGAKKAA